MAGRRDVSILFHGPATSSDLKHENRALLVFQIDCGASVNIVRKRPVSNSKLSPTSKRLVMWNKTEI